MSAEEPLYCAICGAEDWECGHSFSSDGYYHGPWCEACGVKHEELGERCPLDVQAGEDGASSHV